MTTTPPRTGAAAGPDRGNRDTPGRRASVATPGHCGTIAPTLPGAHKELPTNESAPRTGERITHPTGTRSPRLPTSATGPALTLNRLSSGPRQALNSRATPNRRRP